MAESQDCSEWTTDELFSYAITQGLIDPDETFEDWMNDRSDLYRIVQDDLDNLPVPNLFLVGDEVFWTDPDEGHSSGIYKIVKVLTEDGDSSIYLLSNGVSEVEAYEYEFNPLL